MPKRPCAIALTADDSQILSADKFGDVYSLPLLPIEEDEEYFAANKRTTGLCPFFVTGSCVNAHGLTGSQPWPA